MEPVDWGEDMETGGDSWGFSVENSLKENEEKEAVTSNVTLSRKDKVHVLGGCGGD